MDARHPLAVVTPTLDGDVLNHLALAQVPFTPGQLSRLLPKASVEGTRRVLHRLAEQGIVSATSVGNVAVTYELNREHLAANAILALANQSRELRERIEAALAGWAEPPVYAALFGSWARGSANSDSDIDLFFVRPDRADDDWDAQLGALQHDVSRWTGNDARPFVIDASELSQRADDPVLGSIRSEGLTLHGDGAWFRRQVTSHRPTERHVDAR